MITYTPRTEVHRRTRNLRITDCRGGGRNGDELNYLPKKMRGEERRKGGGRTNGLTLRLGANSCLLSLTVNCLSLRTKTSLIYRNKVLPVLLVLGSRDAGLIVRQINPASNRIESNHDGEADIILSKLGQWLLFWLLEF